MGRRVLGSKQLICWSNVSRCVEGHGEEGTRKQAAHLLEQCKPLCGRAWGGGIRRHDSDVGVAFNFMA